MMGYRTMLDDKFALCLIALQYPNIQTTYHLSTLFILTLNNIDHDTLHVMSTL